jgi:ribosomal protein S3
MAVIHQKYAKASSKATPTACQHAGVFGVPMLERKPQVLKPNYQFEKRQRENEKKKKKAEKAERKASGMSTESETPGPDAEPAPEPAPPEQR